MKKKLSSFCLDEEPHQRDAVRPVVGVPLDAVRRARFAGEVGRRGRVEDDEPVARLRQVLDRERHARIGDVENRSHPALVIPLPRDGEADVDLVLMIGDEELDRLAEHGAAEILDRHPRHLDRAGAGQIGVGAGLIVHDPDREAIGGASERRPGGKGQEKAEGENSPDHGAAPGAAVRASPNFRAKAMVARRRRVRLASAGRVHGRPRRPSGMQVRAP